jgi:curved DNA-binding protein CbpA
MADVKRAYRRLAKAYHPDSAGEAALPRFLAIHEAYELLVTGRPRAAGPRPSRATPAAEPWRADPDRARTARERARGKRGWSGATGSTGASGPRSGSSTRAGGSGRTGTAGPEFGRSRTGSSGGSGGSGPGTREGRRRATRKATLGSTSYDEAREHTDATWSGASWYGPTSGEYWIVNPREYADPRKHGPGYQQRARRTAATGDVETGTAKSNGAGEPEDLDHAVDDSAEAEVPRAGRRTARPPTTTAEGPTAEDIPRSTSARDAKRWRASARPAWAAAGDDANDPAGEKWKAREQGWPGGGRPRDPIGSLGAAGRDLLGSPTDDPIRRLGLALVAWPPVGLAAAAAIGDITGCTAYSAECGGSDTLLPWLAQAAILGLLLLLPPLARLFVGGTIAVLVALVPITALLIVIGAGGAPQAGFVLALLLAGAWLVGVAWARRGVTRSTA